MTMRPSVTVFVVDDDLAVREGLAALLGAKGYTVEAFESAEAFLASSSDLRSGVLLLDARLPGMSGLELQRELKTRGAAPTIIIITGHGDVPMAVAALKAGAADFLEKPFDSDTLLSAIDEALRRPLAPLPESSHVVEKAAQLTPREREVMQHVTAGLPNKIIATRLRIAVRTVEIHRARVMEKMGARSLSELVRMAIRLDGGA